MIALRIVVPALIGLAAIELVGWRTGATLSVREAAAIQGQNPNLVWFGAFNQYAPFKVERMAIERPEIVFIGDSRCNETRSAMFSPYTMYNACISAWTFDQIRDTIDKISERHRPKIVIITLDYFMFTDEFAQAWSKQAAMDFAQSRAHLDQLIALGTAFKSHFLTLLNDAPDYLGGRKRNDDGWELLGLNAILAQGGIRPDGSFLYQKGTYLAASAANRDAPHTFLAAVHGGVAMTTGQIAALAKLADRTKQLGIVLVGIQLPVVGSVVDFLDTDQTYWPYAGIWRQFESDATKQMFRDLDIHFFDMIRDDVTADERNFVDPAHPGEAGILGALVHRLDDPEFRAVFPRLDADAMRRDYAAAQARGEFFNIYGNRH